MVQRKVLERWVVIQGIAGVIVHAIGVAHLHEYDISIQGQNVLQFGVAIRVGSKAVEGVGESGRECEQNFAVASARSKDSLFIIFGLKYYHCRPLKGKFHGNCLTSY